MQDAVRPAVSVNVVNQPPLPKSVEEGKNLHGIRLP